MAMGKNSCHDSMVTVNSDQPSTSKVYDYEKAVVEDYDSDSDEDVFSIETTIPIVVVERVYEETE